METSFHTNTVRGSIFAMIFIAIGLFAALSYALFHGGQVGEQSLTKEQSKLAAMEIVSMGDNVAAAVQQLRLRGCLETQISFDSPNTWGMYVNPSAPTNESCHVFSTSGGKVLHDDIAPKYQMPSATLHYYWFNSETPVTNVGTSAPELLIWVTNLKYEVCKEINNYINAEDPEVESIGSHTQAFTGSYASVVPGGIGDDPGSIYAGKRSGCMGGVSNNYYKVLIAR